MFTFLLLATSALAYHGFDTNGYFEPAMKMAQCDRMTLAQASNCATGSSNCFRFQMYNYCPACGQCEGSNKDFAQLDSSFRLPTCIPLSGAQARSCDRLEQILQQYPEQCSISSWLKPHCAACGECSNRVDRFESASVASPLSSEFDDSGIQKILNGEQVSMSNYLNRYGYVGAMRGNAGPATGFMVNSRWGITVRHLNLQAGRSVIRPAWRRLYDNGNLHANWLDTRTVSRFCNHPTVDVAIFQIDRNWPNSKFAQVSGFNTNRQVAVNEQIRALGWGSTVMETGSLGDSNWLRTSTGHVDMVDGMNVPDAFRGQNLGTCPGDSGSPATSLDGNIIYGVQFNIDGACTRDSSFARYTNLHRIGNWVSRVINNGDFSQCA